MLSFTKNNGEFILQNPHKVSYTYFPLCNEHGMKSSITPTLQGDIKLNQHQFFLPPVSQDDLHQTGNGRNFWIHIFDEKPFSITSNSALQRLENDELTLEAGFLWHKISLERKGLKCETLTFVPSVSENIEITRVTITNISDKDVCFVPWSVSPIYARSADNIRDHRHVTALLNQFILVDKGIINTPTLTFDERGHHINQTHYGMFTQSAKGESPQAYYPVLEEFIGEGGSLDWPRAIVESIPSNYTVGDMVSGYEGIGGFKYTAETLSAGDSVDYFIGYAIYEGDIEPEHFIHEFLNTESFEQQLSLTKAYWENELSRLKFDSGNQEMDSWMKWVTLQPILRRIYGCSFLPHHDYGRGGRGWRDLWQDCLALIIMNPDPVRHMLLNNFAGVRLDGTNATIIGNALGEFKADRNNIPRVWMDHGLWPLVTTQLYLDRTGDMSFLFEKQTYFNDANTHYGRKKQEQLDEKRSIAQCLDGTGYRGTILEHMLVQNMVATNNIGEHGSLRLEGADWNDGLDMARNRGESVAFTAAYIGNLEILLSILTELKRLGIHELEVAQEMVPLFLNQEKTSPQETNRLYFERVETGVIREKTDIKIDELVVTLMLRKEILKKTIQEQEWISINQTSGFFNGYYDNNGNKLEGILEKSKTGNVVSGKNESGNASSGESESIKVNMTLTGQVFTLMYGVATKDQIPKMINAADTYLLDTSVGGYKLNTNFEEVKLSMGRLFGFAYGHKENGAMFSHMAIMYSNALYKQGYGKEGFRVIQLLFEHMKSFETSKIYPGIPEYVDAKGRGMYHYLTGSASWLILTMLNEVYGIQGHFGDLIIAPSIPRYLLKADNSVGLTTYFADRLLKVTYVYDSSIIEGVPLRVNRLIIQGKSFETKELSPFVLDVDSAAMIQKIVFSRDYLMKLGQNGHKEEELAIEVHYTT